MSAANGVSPAAPAQEWTMPWACRECRRFGQARGVVVATGARTTDDELLAKLDRAHRAESPICITPPHRIVHGRLWRLEFTVISSALRS